MKINPGDTIRCKKYGKGTCTGVDPTNKDFMFKCRFNDGTLVWLSKFFVTRYVKKVTA